MGLSEQQGQLRLQRQKERQQLLLQQQQSLANFEKHLVQLIAAAAAAISAGSTTVRDLQRHQQQQPQRQQEQQKGDLNTILNWSEVSEELLHREKRVPLAAAVAEAVTVGELLLSELQQLAEVLSAGLDESSCTDLSSRPYNTKGATRAVETCEAAPQKVSTIAAIESSKRRKNSADVEAAQKKKQQLLLRRREKRQQQHWEATAARVIAAAFLSLHKLLLHLLPVWEQLHTIHHNSTRQHSTAAVSASATTFRPLLETLLPVFSLLLQLCCHMQHVFLLPTVNPATKAEAACTATAPTAAVKAAASEGVKSVVTGASKAAAATGVSAVEGAPGTARASVRATASSAEPEAAGEQGRKMLEQHQGACTTSTTKTSAGIVSGNAPVSSSPFSCFLWGGSLLPAVRFLALPAVQSSSRLLQQLLQLIRLSFSQAWPLLLRSQYVLQLQLHQQQHHSTGETPLENAATSPGAAERETAHHPATASAATLPRPTPETLEEDAACEVLLHCFLQSVQGLRSRSKVPPAAVLIGVCIHELLQLLLTVRQPASGSHRSCFCCLPTTLQQQQEKLDSDVLLLALRCLYTVADCTHPPAAPRQQQRGSQAAVSGVFHAQKQEQQSSSHTTSSENESLTAASTIIPLTTAAANRAATRAAVLLQYYPGVVSSLCAFLVEVSCSRHLRNQHRLFAAGLLVLANWISAVLKASVSHTTAAVVDSVDFSNSLAAASASAEEKDEEKKQQPTHNDVSRSFTAAETELLQKQQNIYAGCTEKKENEQQEQEQDQEQEQEQEQPTEMFWGAFEELQQLAESSTGRRSSTDYIESASTTGSSGAEKGSPLTVNCTVDHCTSWTGSITSRAPRTEPSTSSSFLNSPTLFMTPSSPHNNRNQSSSSSSSKDSSHTDNNSETGLDFHLVAALRINFSKALPLLQHQLKQAAEQTSTRIQRFLLSSTNKDSELGCLLKDWRVRLCRLRLADACLAYSSHDTLGMHSAAITTVVQALADEELPVQAKAYQLLLQQSPATHSTTPPTAAVFSPISASTAAHFSQTAAPAAAGAGLSHYFLASLNSANCIAAADSTAGDRWMRRLLQLEDTRRSSCHSASRCSSQDWTGGSGLLTRKFAEVEEPGFVQANADFFSLEELPQPLLQVLESMQVSGQLRQRFLGALQAAAAAAADCATSLSAHEEQKKRTRLLCPPASCSHESQSPTADFLLYNQSCFRNFPSRQAGVFYQQLCEVEGYLRVFALTADASASARPSTNDNNENHVWLVPADHKLLQALIDLSLPDPAAIRRRLWTGRTYKNNSSTQKHQHLLLVLPPAQLRALQEDALSLQLLPSFPKQLFNTAATQSNATSSASTATPTPHTITRTTNTTTTTTTTTISTRTNPTISPSPLTTTTTTIVTSINSSNDTTTTETFIPPPTTTFAPATTTNINISKAAVTATTQPAITSATTTTNDDNANNSTALITCPNITKFATTTAKNDDNSDKSTAVRTCPNITKFATTIFGKNTSGNANTSGHGRNGFSGGIEFQDKAAACKGSVPVTEMAQEAAKRGLASTAATAALFRKDQPKKVERLQRDKAEEIHKTKEAEEQQVEESEKKKERNAEEKKKEEDKEEENEAERQQGKATTGAARRYGGEKTTGKNGENREEAQPPKAEEQQRGNEDAKLEEGGKKGRQKDAKREKHQHEMHQQEEGGEVRAGCLGCRVLVQDDLNRSVCRCCSRWRIEFCEETRREWQQHSFEEQHEMEQQIFLPCLAAGGGDAGISNKVQQVLEGLFAALPSVSRAALFSLLLQQLLHPGLRSSRTASAAGAAEESQGLAAAEQQHLTQQEKADASFSQGKSSLRRSDSHSEVLNDSQNSVAWLRRSRLAQQQQQRPLLLLLPLQQQQQQQQSGGRAPPPQCLLSATTTTAAASSSSDAPPHEDEQGNNNTQTPQEQMTDVLLVRCAVLFSLSAALRAFIVTTAHVFYSAATGAPPAQKQPQKKQQLPSDERPKQHKQQLVFPYARDCKYWYASRCSAVLPDIFSPHQQSPCTTTGSWWYGGGWDCCSCSDSSSRKGSIMIEKGGGPLLLLSEKEIDALIETLLDPSVWIGSDTAAETLAAAVKPAPSSSAAAANLSEQYLLLLPLIHFYRLSLLRCLSLAFQAAAAAARLRLGGQQKQQRVAEEEKKAIGDYEERMTQQHIPFVLPALFQQLASRSCRAVAAAAYLCLLSLHESLSLKNKGSFSSSSCWCCCCCSDSHDHQEDDKKGHKICGVDSNDRSSSSRDGKGCEHMRDPLECLLSRHGFLLVDYVAQQLERSSSPVLLLHTPTKQIRTYQKKELRLVQSTPLRHQQPAFPCSRRAAASEKKEKEEEEKKKLEQVQTVVDVFDSESSKNEKLSGDDDHHHTQQQHQALVVVPVSGGAVVCTNEQRQTHNTKTREEPVQAAIGAFVGGGRMEKAAAEEAGELLTAMVALAPLKMLPALGDLLQRLLRQQQQQRQELLQLTLLCSTSSSSEKKTRPVSSLLLRQHQQQLLLPPLWLLRLLAAFSFLLARTVAQHRQKFIAAAAAAAADSAAAIQSKKLKKKSPKMKTAERCWTTKGKAGGHANEGCALRNWRRCHFTGSFRWLLNPVILEQQQAQEQQMLLQRSRNPQKQLLLTQRSRFLRLQGKRRWYSRSSGDETTSQCAGEGQTEAGGRQQALRMTPACVSLVQQPREALLAVMDEDATDDDAASSSYSNSSSRSSSIGGRSSSIGGRSSCGGSGVSVGLSCGSRKSRSRRLSTFRCERPSRRTCWNSSGGRTSSETDVASARAGGRHLRDNTQLQSRKQQKRLPGGAEELRPDDEDDQEEKKKKEEETELSLGDRSQEKNALQLLCNESSNKSGRSRLRKVRGRRQTRLATEEEKEKKEAPSRTGGQERERFSAHRLKAKELLLRARLLLQTETRLTAKIFLHLTILRSFFVLTTKQKELLPLIHQLWPSLLPSLAPQAPLSTVVITLGIVRLLAASAGAFFRQRFSADVLPPLLQRLQQQQQAATASEEQSLTEEYKFEHTWISLLLAIAACGCNSSNRKKDSSESCTSISWRLLQQQQHTPGFSALLLKDILGEAIFCCFFFLSKTSAASLQQRARELLLLLNTVDHQLVLLLVSNVAALAALLQKGEILSNSLLPHAALPIDPRTAVFTTTYHRRNIALAYLNTAAHLHTITNSTQSIAPDPITTEPEDSSTTAHFPQAQITTAPTPHHHAAANIEFHTTAVLEQQSADVANNSHGRDFAAADQHAAAPSGFRSSAGFGTSADYRASVAVKDTTNATNLGATIDTANCAGAARNADGVADAAAYGPNHAAVINAAVDHATTARSVTANVNAATAAVRHAIPANSLNPEREATVDAASIATAASRLLQFVAFSTCKRKLVDMEAWKRVTANVDFSLLQQLQIQLLREQQQHFFGRRLDSCTSGAHSSSGIVCSNASSGNRSNTACCSRNGGSSSSRHKSTSCSSGLLGGSSNSNYDCRSRLNDEDNGTSRSVDTSNDSSCRDASWAARWEGKTVQQFPYGPLGRAFCQLREELEEEHHVKSILSRKEQKESKFI